MIPIDLGRKVALVTGVGDNVGFAWHIAKALQAAGARLLLAVHPRMVNIVQSLLDRDADAEYRVLPFNAGTLRVPSRTVVAITISSSCGRVATPWR